MDVEIRSASGSSSGSAALVVAGECDMTIGGDQGDSIRFLGGRCAKHQHAQTLLDLGAKLGIPVPNSAGIGRLALVVEAGKPTLTVPRPPGCGMISHSFGLRAPMVSA